MSLFKAGRGDSEIASLTGIPRSTISAWRHGRGVRYHHRLSTARASWRPPDSRSYSYLLGVYLGDGCIVTTPAGAAWLVITLDVAYPGIVEETASAVKACFPATSVRRYARSDGSVAALQVTPPRSPVCVPRSMARAASICDRSNSRIGSPAITRRFPRELLRGLIHSDGCRTVNRFKTRAAVRARGRVRLSALLLQQPVGRHPRVFCESCERLGLRWTQSNHRNISISHRTSVALLDEYMGPKC